jgi:uroporphyrinogen-III synthase
MIADDRNVDLCGAVVGITAARSAAAQAEQVRRVGGLPIVAPTVATAPADEALQRTVVARLLDDLLGRRVDLLILLTGVGTRALATAATELGRRDDLLAGLTHTRVLARGYKCVAALRSLGCQPNLIPEEPTTAGVVRELGGLDLQGCHVALQAYGAPAAALGSALALSGAETSVIPLYRYRLPDDDGPVLSLLDALDRGQVEAVTFTSPPAASHLFLIAEAHERADLLRANLRRPRVAVAAVGPSTAAALRDQEVRPDVVADPPRLFPMLEGLAAHLAARQASLNR